MATRKLDKKPKEATEIQIIRPKRARLSADEVRKRMEEFAEKRKEEFIAAVRKGKD
jgi:hypothetical protein